MQALLSHGQGWSVPPAEVVQAELHALSASAAGRVRVEGPAVELPGDAVQGMAMALHELATNALKHGALAGLAGQVEVTWTISEARSGTGALPRLALFWHESGVRLPEAPPTHWGYGRELIEHALPCTLGGETRFEFTRDGVRCSISVPLAARQPAL